MTNLSPARLLILAVLLCLGVSTFVSAVLLASLGVDALKAAIPVVGVLSPIVGGLFTIYRAVERAELKSEARHKGTLLRLDAAMARLDDIDRKTEATLERADEAVSYHREELN